MIEYTLNKCEDLEDLKHCLRDKAVKISGALEINSNVTELKEGGNYND